MIKQQSKLYAEADAIKDRISYIAFFTNKYTADDNLDIDDLIEIFRVVPTKSRVGNKVTYSFTYPEGEGVCPSATITSVNSNQVDITVDDASLFIIGDSVWIELANRYEGEVIDIDGNVITLSEPIGTTSAGGELLKVKISQLALIEGGSASANTGDIYAIGPYNKFKDNTTPDFSGFVEDLYL